MRGEEDGERQREGTAEEEELQLVVHGREREVSTGKKMTGEGGGDGGAAVRRRRRWQLEDGGVAMMAEKNCGQGKEWRWSSWRRSSRRRWQHGGVRRWRRRRQWLDSFPGLP